MADIKQRAVAESLFKRHGRRDAEINNAVSCGIQVRLIIERRLEPRMRGSLMPEVEVRTMYVLRRLRQLAENLFEIIARRR